MDWRVGYKNAINQLSIPSLYGELQKLENSVKHLRRSNEELKTHGEEEGQEGSWVLPIISENGSVIEKQEEQIQLVKGKILEREAQIDIQEGNEMAIDERSNGVSHPIEGTSTRVNLGVGEGMDVDENEGGIHL